MSGDLGIVKAVLSSRSGAKAAIQLDGNLAGDYLDWMGEAVHQGGGSD